MKTETFQQRLETAFPYDTYANTLRALREGSLSTGAVKAPSEWNSGVASDGFSTFAMSAR